VSLCTKVSRNVGNHAYGKKRYNKPIKFIHLEDGDIMLLLKLQHTYTI
jgi:hypothetical protein